VEHSINGVGNDGDTEHPAIVRLRSELAAARRGLAEVAEVPPAHRDRVLAAMRAGVPDAAGRAAYEVGHKAALEEIRRFTAPDLRDVTPATARLWQEILSVAAEAASEAAAGTSGPAAEHFFSHAPDVFEQ
jgi:hypothetical protein